MQRPPSFSVVIPNHARIDTLVAAVRSTLADAPSSLEVIVVDDASPNVEAIDGALRAIADMRVRMVRLAGKGTASIARNAGWAAATGDYVSFLDSDDTFTPQKWHALSAAVQAAPHADVLYDRAEIVIDGRLADVVPHRALRAGEAVGDFLFVHDELLSTCTLTVRRELLSRVPWRGGLPRHQDFQFVLDLEEAGAQFVHVPSAGCVVQWSTASRPIARGESATYSLGWLETVRARLSAAAFRRAAFRFGVVKLLDAGERREAIRVAVRLRAIPDLRAAAVALVLFAAPAVVRRAGYLAFKRLRGALATRTAAPTTTPALRTSAA